MALMQCRGCLTKFAVGLLRCPQCGKVSELFAVPEEVIEAEQEANMPKISVQGGPSNAPEDVAETSVPVAEDSEAPEPEAPEATDEALAVESEPEKAADEAASATEQVKQEPAAAPAPKKRATKKTAAASES